MARRDADDHAGAGDPSLWVRHHGDYLFGFAMSRLADAHAAEDLVQETLLAALEHRDSFESRAQFRTWLVGILKHKIADQRRRAARGGPPAAPADAGTGDEAGPGGPFDARGKWAPPPAPWDRGPDQALLRAELRAALAECLGRLGPRAAQALLLRERHGLAAEAVGKILGLTATNLGVILHRARTALRRCIEERRPGRAG
jgi:RNA polymerase sigma-70 factor (ECF subfamily)